ncbi:MAG: NADH-quinone oxidoreductase subunit NuoN [Gammaproteobacteria bacterium]
MESILKNIILVTPEMFVLTMTCILLMVSVFLKSRVRETAYYLAQLTIVATLGLTLYFLPKSGEVFSLDLHFVEDHFAVVMKLFIYAITFFVFLYARKEIERLQLPAGEFYALCLFSLLGMMVMVSANSTILLFLGIELLSLPLYALVALYKRSHVGSEAALKYFVTGAMATGLLLYGLSLIYGATQSFTFNVIAQRMAQLPVSFDVVLVVGAVFVIAGLAFKLGLVPFHMWVPDVYEGAPVAVTLFLSSAPKIAVFGVIVRLLFEGMLQHHNEWQHFLVLLAVLSIGLGNLLAIAQSSIKRMLAYSSVAHVGYMVLGLIAGTEQGLSAGLFYIIIYAISAAGAFGIIILMSRVGLEINMLSDFRGLNSRNPWLAFLMLVLLLSMAGIPPTAGFFAKFGVIMALVNVHLVWLAVFALVFAIIGAYYYLRVIKIMYFEQVEENLAPVVVSPELNAAVTINSLSVLLLGIFPGVLLDLCRASFGPGVLY